MAKERKIVIDEKGEVIGIEVDGVRISDYTTLAQKPLTIRDIVVPLEVLFTVDNRMCVHQRTTCRYF